MLQFAINIGQNNTLGYWRNRVYGQRDYYWYIKVVFIKNVNQFFNVLYY